MRQDRRSLAATRAGVLALMVAIAACGIGGRQPRTPPEDPAPQTLDEFKSTAQRILTETGVPGAGLALVQQAAVEWAGGIGYADRDAKTPVTAETHFRVGSI